MNKEQDGQFPSKNCECHIDDTYGFVPECDCEEHDTKQFSDFISKIKANQHKEIVEEIDKEIENWEGTNLSIGSIQVINALENLKNKIK